jgi:hypothetical protein
LLFNSTAGTPLFENVNLNGADLAALNLQSSVSNCQVWVAQRALTNDVVFGFYFKTGAPTGGGTRKIFSWEAGATDKAFTLQHNNDGTLSILDNADATVATGTATPFSTNTWHLIEFIFDQATSTTGTVTVYVDGSSVVSTSGQNFTTTGNANKLRWEGPQRVGAWYCLENGTGVSDFLGDFEVRTLQGDGNTNGGDAWDSGTWANVSETPYNGSNIASFTQNAALSNYREDQGGTRAGPNGVSGIGTIYGITYCTIADRGGGSGAGDQKDLLGGNSVDGTTNLLSMGLTTSPELYTIGSESASVVPTSSEYSRIGFAHNGARDMNIFEAWSSLLYAPATGNVTVPVTGVAGTGNVGSVTVATDQVIAVPIGSTLNLQSVGLVGTVTVTTDQVIAVTGLEATGQVGSVNVALGATVPVTGLEATGGVGSVTVTTDQVIAVTGLEATGQVGTVAVSIPVDVPVTGLEATGQVGTVDVTFGITVPVTGLEATGNVGSVNVTTDQVIAVTGQEATGEVGSVTVLAGIIVPVTGLEATGNVGTATALSDTNVSVTGLEATGEVGSVAVLPDTNVAVTGLEATGAVGTVTVLLDIVVPVTGLEASGNVGTVTVTADGLTVVTGLEATGFVGTATAITDQVIAVTGLQATGQVGSVTVDTADTIIFVTGLEADGEIGDAFGLARHVPSQDPNWVEIRP